MNQPARRGRPRKVVGHARPRIAPPQPARHGRKRLESIASTIGQPFWPWQSTVAEYLTAINAAGGRLYSEVLIEAARQNGKTTIMKPYILDELDAGRRIVHTAQDRDLPRQMHEELADIVMEHFRDRLPRRRGIQFGRGMESIRFREGGMYHIVAPGRDGARGHPHDVVIIDEALAMTSMDFVSAAIPSTMGSAHGQIVYFSNAGTAESIVLRWLRERADNDPTLAYLEWSAPEGMAPDDRAGWLMANPAVGHNPAVMPNLERMYASHAMGGTLDIWEREHLCRQTLAAHQALVTPDAWAAQEFVSHFDAPKRPVLGLKMDIGGERASAVLAWEEADERIGLDVIADVVGHPIDTDRFAADLRKVALAKRVSATLFDPYTDADIARHLKRATPLTGRDYANASEKFVRLVAGRQLRVHDDADLLAADLSATIPRTMRGGAFTAIKASPEATNTTAEAAIRAAWQASEKQPTGIARVW